MDMMHAKDYMKQIGLCIEMMGPSHDLCAYLKAYGCLDKEKNFLFPFLTCMISSNIDWKNRI